MIIKISKLPFIIGLRALNIFRNELLLRGNPRRHEVKNAFRRSEVNDDNAMTSNNVKHCELSKAKAWTPNQRIIQ